MSHSNVFLIVSSLILSTSLALTGCQTASIADYELNKEMKVTVETQSLVSNLMFIDENHFTTDVATKAGLDTYIIDTYIIPFQQPYYILVRLDSGKTVNKDMAARVAAEYIKPRGCTEPLVRRTDLDKSNKEGTAILIGFAC